LHDFAGEVPRDRRNADQPARQSNSRNPFAAPAQRATLSIRDTATHAPHCRAKTGPAAFDTDLSLDRI
jgi:hypothetical protein